MHAQSERFGAEAPGDRVMSHDVPVDRSRIEMTIQTFGRAVILDRAEEGPGGIFAVFRECHIVLDQSLCDRRDGNEADFIALTLYPEMHDALTALQIFKNDR